MPGQLRAWAGHPRSSDLRFEGTDRPIWAHAHPPLLAQALANLVDNALKYSGPGTPVTVALRLESGAAVLSVEDCGCGLTREELALVFEPFYRSPSARSLGRSGVGLGLSVVRRIVTASGGMIAAESTPGRGTCFVLRFPAVASPVNDPTRAPAPARQLAGR